MKIDAVSEGNKQHGMDGKRASVLSEGEQGAWNGEEVIIDVVSDGIKQHGMEGKRETVLSEAGPSGMEW